MKRLQLFGNSKYFSISSKEEKPPRESSPARTRSSKPRQSTSKSTDRAGLSLLSLPPKVLAAILEQLDVNTLLSLCQVNSELYKLTSDQFLYRNITLDNKLSLLKFNALIHSEFHTSNALNERHGSRRASQNARFLVRSIKFINPQCQDSLLKYSKFHNKVDQQSIIGGAYHYESALSASNQSRSHSKDRRSRSSSRRSSDKLDHAAAEWYKSICKLEGAYSQYTYIELLLDIVDYLPNLTHIILDEVQPGFKIPLWYSVMNDGSRDFFKKIINGQQSMNRNDLRTFELSESFASDYERRFHTLPRVPTLEIRAALDKRNKHQVHLRPNLLCCFGIINELILQNVIIDTESLDTPWEFMPFHLKTDLPGFYDVHSTTRKLTLKSCHILPGSGILKLFHQYFKCVKELQLLQITSKFDMLLCSCFTSLTHLTIDCNSKCFVDEAIVSDDYYYKKQDISAEYNEDSDGDLASVTETLLDPPVDNSLLAPPPTSPVVLSINRNYLTRAAVQSQLGNRKMAIITNSQSDFFKFLRVPAFHVFYHYYKKLWDRLPRKNINISIVNIPFTNVFPMSPQLFCDRLLRPLTDDQQTLIPLRTSRANGTDQDRQYYWNDAVKNCLRDSIQASFGGDTAGPTMIDTLSEISSDILNNHENFKMFQDIPNLNSWFFLKSLSEFKSVRIHMLKRWLFCTPRTRYDWEILLKPVLNVNVPIEVRDKDGYVLYSYGSRMTDVKG